MNAVGVPTGLSPRALAQLTAHRDRNEGLLIQTFGSFDYIQLVGEPAARVHLTGPGLLFPSTLLNEETAHFLTEVDAMVAEAVSLHSAALHQAHTYAAAVPPNFGRVYFLTTKLLGEMASPPRCSICLDALLSPDQTRRKVWQLHGQQCTFHVGCVRRWFRESSHCPNCNLDCAVPPDG